MFFVLLKKQLLELNSFYFVSRKTGKKRSTAGIVGMLAFYVFILISFGFSFYGYSTLLADSLIGTELSWLYFAIMGLGAFTVGILGSVLTTYASIYKAKDNDLLVSLPIKSSLIVVSKIVGVFATSLLFETIAWLPVCIAAWQRGLNSAGAIVSQFVVLIFVALVVTIVTCLLGWLIAVLSSKIKNKSLVTAVFTVVFLGAYYYVIGSLSSSLNSIILDLANVGEKVKSLIYPSYLLGKASCGDVLALVLVMFGSLALFGAGYLIISHNFVKIVTMKKGEERKKYVETTVKTNSVTDALFSKELKRFLSIPTYLINGGMGVVVMLAASVLALIKKAYLRELLETLTVQLPQFVSLVPALLASPAILFSSMDAITAPSISLEGKTLWLLKSLPVDSKEVLKAKVKLQLVVNAVPTMLLTLVLCLVLQVEKAFLVLSLASTFICMCFMAKLGLVIDLAHPVLNWTNEVIPIKQNIGVLVAVFGGMIIAALCPLACFLLRDKVSVQNVMSCFVVVVALAYRWLTNWLNTKGVKLFAEL